MSGLFGSSKVETPQPKPPPPMADPQSPDVLAARRRIAAGAEMRAGRQSTVLTTPETRTLAGGAYAAKELGG